MELLVIMFSPWCPWNLYNIFLGLWGSRPAFISRRLYITLLWKISWVIKQNFPSKLTFVLLIHSPQWPPLVPFLLNLRRSWEGESRLVSKIIWKVHNLMAEIKFHSICKFWTPYSMPLQWCTKQRHLTYANQKWITCNKCLLNIKVYDMRLFFDPYNIEQKRRTWINFHRSL